MSNTLAQAVPGDHIRISMDPSTEPFWHAAKEQRLVAPQCANCGTYHMPPRPYCPECQGKQFNWNDLPGTGCVYSFAICNRSPYPDVADFVYVPAVIDIDGAPGVRLVSNIVDVDPATVTIGMRVKVAWNPITEGWLLPIFQSL